jgi:hypothetical protein
MNIIKKRIRRLKMRIMLFMYRFKKVENRKSQSFIYEEPRE